MWTAKNKRKTYSEEKLGQIMDEFNREKRQLAELQSSIAKDVRFLFLDKVKPKRRQDIRDHYRSTTNLAFNESLKKKIETIISKMLKLFFDLEKNLARGNVTTATKKALTKTSRLIAQLKKVIDYNHAVGNGKNVAPETGYIIAHGIYIRNGENLLKNALATLPNTSEILNQSERNQLMYVLDNMYTHQRINSRDIHTFEKKLHQLITAHEYNSKQYRAKILNSLQLICDNVVKTAYKLSKSNG